MRTDPTHNSFFVDGGLSLTQRAAFAKRLREWATKEAA